MKLVTAIIKPFKLEDVQESLRDLEIQGMTVTQVAGSVVRAATARSTAVPSTT